METPNRHRPTTGARPPLNLPWKGNSVTHYEECQANVTREAHRLMRAGCRNIRAQLEAKVESPAYYPEWRRYLVEAALADIQKMKELNQCQP